MGIFGAMTTAVAGLQAQSYALENISGNIANSQTSGYKRIETSFSDMVMSVGQSAARQSAGSVLARSRPTNMIQGAVNRSEVDTHMAINGDGYFQVQTKVGETDGLAQFSGANLYTRRGDFVMDREGYLVNGAGYYLMGIPVDPATGNPKGDVAEVLQLSTGFLQARQSTRIEYAANLPSNPRVGQLSPGDYTVNPTLGPAAAATSPRLVDKAYSNIDLSVTPATDKFSFDIVANNGSTKNTYPITLTAASGGSDSIVDITEAVAAINAQLPSGSNITAAVGTGADAGKIVLTSTITGASSQLSVGNVVKTGTTSPTTSLGLDSSTAAAKGTNAIPAGSGNVTAADVGTFQRQSLEGGSTSAYDSLGTKRNVQLRWAKTGKSPDTWNLFYQQDSAATGSQVMWKNVGSDFVFDASGKLTTPSGGKITIPNMMIDGANLGNITFEYGSTGLTQFSTTQGNVDVTLIDQDGYASGSLISVGVSDDGRVTANYTNGQQVDVAEIPLYQFNGDSELKRLDGNAFMVTRESGPPMKMNATSIAGQALEGSNTDIAEEFSRMIITQQAYSANSRIITTANDMMQDVLNIVR